MCCCGLALSSDDIAGDLRDDCGALIEDGLDDDAATRQILGFCAGVLDDPATGLSPGWL